MFQKTVLDNGIRIITEKVPSRTVSVGLWVNVGSRDEEESNNGCAHFVEHMLFKGTPKRTAQQIAQEFDNLGGMSNAFTANETTCFYATVLDDKLSEVVELSADIFRNSLFDQEEVEREREVVLQEISMVEDTPDDRVHELFGRELWGTHPLGYTVLGRREVIASIDSATVRDYVERFYTPDRIVIAASGNVDHARFCELWQQMFAGFNRPAAGRVTRGIPSTQPLVRKVVNKPLEQMHMVLGTYGLPIAAEERYILFLFNILLGGNMSSRLFQEVREKQGLAYSIYSYLSSYTDSGYLGIYLGVDPGAVNKTMGLVAREISALCAGDFSEEELRNARDYATAGVYLAAENMEARMTRIARNELSFGRHIELSEVVDGFARVTRQDVAALAQRLCGTPLFALGLGPMKTDAVDWRLLEVK